MSMQPHLFTSLPVSGEPIPEKVVRPAKRIAAALAAVRKRLNEEGLDVLDADLDAIEKASEDLRRQLIAALDKPSRKGRADLEAVVNFVCGELRLPRSDAEWFFFKMEGCGWKNGGKPVNNWQMTCRAWERGGYFPSCRSGNGTSLKPNYSRGL